MLRLLQVPFGDEVRQDLVKRPHQRVDRLDETGQIVILKRVLWHALTLSEIVRSLKTLDVPLPTGSGIVCTRGV